MRIAVYSANIGNYRNELASINDITCVPGADYYFFTDANITSTKWKVIKVGLRQPTKWLDAERNTAKYYKWVIPKILRTYDVVVWMDSKVTRKLLKIWSRDVGTYIDNISTLVKSNPQSDLFLWKHPSRTHARQELSLTMKTKKENKGPGEHLMSLVKLKQFKVALPDTCVMITRTTEKSLSALAKVYVNLLAIGVSRDQNIIQYSLDITGMDSRTQMFNDRTTLFPPRPRVEKVRKEIHVNKKGIGINKNRR